MNRRFRERVTPSTPSYPTHGEARRGGRLLLAGLGAAVLSTAALACEPFATSGEFPPPELDASSDAGDGGHGADSGAPLPVADAGLPE